MEIDDRTLMALKLILWEFGIHVGKSLEVKQSSPNMDLISSCISLLQIVHPMTYKFELILVAGRHRIRSKKLVNEIEILQKKVSSGHLVLLERQYTLNAEVKGKIQDIIKEIRTPDNVSFGPEGWLFFLGFYNIVSRICDSNAVLEVMMRDYLDLLPYMDLAEETLKTIQYNKV